MDQGELSKSSKRFLSVPTLSHDTIVYVLTKVGIPIVTSEWVYKSHEESKFVPIAPFLASTFFPGVTQEEKGERRPTHLHDSSYDKVRPTFLQKKRIYIGPATTIHKPMLTELIEAVGGAGT